MMDSAFTHVQAPEMVNSHSPHQLDQDFEDIRTSMGRIEELLHFGQNLLYGEENHAENAVPQVSCNTEQRAFSSQVNEHERGRHAPHVHMAHMPQQGLHHQEQQCKQQYQQQQQQQQQQMRQPKQQTRGPQAKKEVPPSKRSRRASSRTNWPRHSGSHLDPLQQAKPIRKGMTEGNAEKEDLTLEEIQQRIRDELAEYRLRRDAKRLTRQTASHISDASRIFVRHPSKQQEMSVISHSRQRNHSTGVVSSLPDRSRRTPTKGFPRSQSAKAEPVRASRRRNRSLTDTGAQHVFPSNDELELLGASQEKHLPVWERLFEDAAKLNEKRHKAVEHRKEEYDMMASRTLPFKDNTSRSMRLSLPTTLSAMSQSTHPHLGYSTSFSTSLTQAANHSTVSGSRMGPERRTPGGQVPHTTIACGEKNSSTSQKEDVQNGSSSHPNGRSATMNNSTVGENTPYKDLNVVKHAASEEAMLINGKELQEPKEALRKPAQQPKNKFAEGKEVLEISPSAGVAHKPIMSSTIQNASPESGHSSPPLTGVDTGHREPLQAPAFCSSNFSATPEFPVAPLDLRALRK